MYMKPKWPIFLKVNPRKQCLCQSKRRSFGFQVYIYIYICFNLYNTDSILTYHFSLSLKPFLSFLQPPSMFFLMVSQCLAVGGNKKPDRILFKRLSSAEFATTSNQTKLVILRVCQTWPSIKWGQHLENDHREGGLQEFRTGQKNGTQWSRKSKTWRRWNCTCPQSLSQLGTKAQKVGGWWAGRLRSQRERLVDESSEDLQFTKIICVHRRG